MISKGIVLAIGLISILTINGQNITDLSVAGDVSSPVMETVEDANTVDDSVFAYPERIKYDNKCFIIEGKDEFIYSGTMHYFRIPRPLWSDRLSKLKAAGMNCVETYVPWNYHEVSEPSSLQDFSKIDLSDLHDFVKMAIDSAFYVIVRPGPYICAEWKGGGFPQWIMNKRTSDTNTEIWLQSNDYEFVQWNKHWYDAVCREIAPLQITRRAPESKGIIMMQIENEYNRVKWVNSKDKESYLANLADIVRDNGIDVPIITCWTSEARNSSHPSLNGIIDMVNSYPRWDIEKNFGRLINQQLSTQPGKPLLSGELQGGWYSDIDGKLSWEQDGIDAVHTQNITLYALQRGFCGLNYYMAVGGTNFDDMASRGVTTTYDFAAAIGEDGMVNNRFYRLKDMAGFLKDHGTKIARAKEKTIYYHTTDENVKLALRVTSTGDKYYFIRTEEHTLPHSGRITTDNLNIDFDLEPFGSKVYLVRNGESEGEWLPNTSNNNISEIVSDTSIITPLRHFTDKLPVEWHVLKPGEYVDLNGEFSRHLIYYRLKAAEGSELEINLVGDKMMNNTKADEILVSVGGSFISANKSTDTGMSYVIPGNSSETKDILILYESKGLHHHTNGDVERTWHIGPLNFKCNGEPIDVEWASTEKEAGISLSNGQNTPIYNDGNGMISWYVYQFTSDKNDNKIRHLNLNHKGNGFLYLNGHCLGRIWQGGAQCSYYLPECWLKNEELNTIALSLRPVDGLAQVEEASITTKTIIK